MRTLLLLSFVVCPLIESVSAQSVRQVAASTVDEGDGLEWTFVLDEYSRLHDKYLQERIPSVLDDLTALYLNDAVLRVGDKSVEGRDNIKDDLKKYITTVLTKQRKGRLFREIRSTVQVAVASETEVVCLIESTTNQYHNTLFFARSSRYDVVAIRERDGKWGIAVEVLGAVKPKSLTTKSGGLAAVADATLVDIYRRFDRTSPQTTPR